MAGPKRASQLTSHFRSRDSITVESNRSWERAFFKSMRDCFDRAAERAGVVRRFYTIGDRTLEVCFAGPVLVPFLTPALAHLALPHPPRRPDLVVSVWDSESTLVQVPSCPLDLRACGHRNGVMMLGAPDPYIFLSNQGILSTISLADSRACYWVRDPRLLPAHELAAPFRSLLHVWLRTLGIHLLHAGAVGTGAGGLLLSGKGGTGKSSTALLCLGAGMDYAGDDFCPVASGEQPHALGLYGTAKVDRGMATKLPFLAAEDNTDLRDGDKRVLFLQSCFPQRITRILPLRALLVPTITGRPETRVQPIPAGKALRAAAPSTLFLLPGSEPEDFFALAELVRVLPCFELQLGSKLETIPEVLQLFVEQVSQ